ncbi:MAG: ROK family protein [Bacilli bacterium]
MEKQRIESCVMPIAGQNSTRNKYVNRVLVLNTLLRRGALPRKELALLTRLTPATMTKITAELIAEGLVHEIGVVQGQDNKVGRKSISLDLIGHAYWVLGVHVRSDRLELGLADIKGVICAQRTILLRKGIQADDFLSFLADEIREFMTAQQPRKVSAIGVGVVGLVSFCEGAILSAQHLGWRDVKVKARLQEEFGIPVFVENNVQTMALAEVLFSRSNETPGLVCVYIGQGIGAGLVIRDQIYQGGLAGGEFGHMTYWPHGESCWCGNTGCLERYASEPVVLKELGLSTIADLADLSQSDSARVDAVLREAGERIGTVLASLLNMVYVPTVIIGGTLAAVKYPLVEQIRRVVNQQSFLARMDPVVVMPSRFEERLGMMGAASLALVNTVFQMDGSTDKQTKEG